MTPEVVSPPEADPVTIGQVKSLLRVDGDALDALLAALVPAATNYLERAYGCAAMAQTRRAWFDAADVTDAPLVLPIWPVSEVTSVVVYDADGVATTLDEDDYQVDLVSALPRVVFKDTAPVPIAGLRPVHAVAIEFEAGATNEATVPSVMGLALAQLVGHWLEHPEGAATAEPASVRALMAAIAPVGLA